MVEAFVAIAVVQFVVAALVILMRAEVTSEPSPPEG
jgi:hypothetical protein